MKINRLVRLCFVIVLTTAWLGCGEAVDDNGGVSDPTANDDGSFGIGTETTGPAVEVAGSVASEVMVRDADPSTGSTLEIYADGTCNMARHDRENPFEFVMKGRMSYGIRISNADWFHGDWHINPLAEATNETDSKLYAHYYAAFFDDQGYIVGCCNQGIDVDPGGSPMQLGSLIITGPKDQLLKATRFKIVIYESDKRIGSQPISASATESMVGRSGKVITKLNQTGMSVEPGEGHQELRLAADVTLEDPADGSRNDHLKIESEAKYDIYVNAAKSERVIQFGDGRKEQYESWDAAIEFDPVDRIPGVSAPMHAALLDESGRLVCCSNPSSAWQLPAPEDRLLAVRMIEFGGIRSVAKR